MIDRIRLKNFQSHVDSELEFHPGVNVISGRSDSGKSAILRGVNWVKNNRPSGDSFRSWHGGKTECIIETEGYSIRRTKDNNINEYAVDEEVYTAMGVGVPEEVKIALNFEDVNIQAQFDSPFLLTLSPGEVANHFNKLANIEKINTSLTEAQSRINEIKRSIKSDVGYVKSTMQELAEFTDVDKLSIEVELLVEDDARSKQLGRQIETLSRMIVSIETVSEKLEDKDDLSLLEELVDELLKWHEKRGRIDKNITSLRLLLTNYQAVEDELMIGKKQIAFLPKIIKINKDMERRDLVGSKVNGLKGVISNYRDLESNIKQVSAMLQTSQASFASQMPKICPLCGSNLKDV